MTTETPNEPQTSLNVPAEAKIVVLARQRDDALNAAANWEAAAMHLHAENAHLREALARAEQPTKGTP